MSWKEVKNNEDVGNLLNTFGNFHDSCLKELYMSTGSYVDESLSMSISVNLDTTIRILFQRQYANPSAIELLFEGVTQFCISPNPKNHDSIIYEAKILCEDDSFHWTDNIDWYPNRGISPANLISAQQLKWRDVSSWMGNRQRYGWSKE